MEKEQFHGEVWRKDQKRVCKTTNQVKETWTNFFCPTSTDRVFRRWWDYQVSQTFNTIHNQNYPWLRKKNIKTNWQKVLDDEKEFNQEVEEFEEFDVASCLLQKEEEEELIEHFLELIIDENKAAAPVHDQEIDEIQDPEVLNEEKPSSAKDPKKKQLKITSFFK